MTLKQFLTEKGKGYYGIFVDLRKDKLSQWEAMNLLEKQLPSDSYDVKWLYKKNYFAVVRFKRANIKSYVKKERTQYEN